MSGKAYLVGAGPGRPDLITVRGLQLLRRADMVLYDHLVARELLDEVPPHAERVFVGKDPERHTVTQEVINELLVDRVRAGLQVVRLKGGDPFVFGRGGEEAIALARAGVPFEVVPGVTSGIAAPASAGIPVTHRGVANSVTFVSGHSPGNVDWQALARSRGTLVIYMAVAGLARIVDALLGAGLLRETPAAAIERGTWESQRIVRASIADLPGEASRAALSSPAILVVGECVALADEIARDALPWTARKVA